MLIKNVILLSRQWLEFPYLLCEVSPYNGIPINYFISCSLHCTKTKKKVSKPFLWLKYLRLNSQKSKLSSMLMAGEQTEHSAAICFGQKYKVNF